MHLQHWLAVGAIAAVAHANPSPAANPEPQITATPQPSQTAAIAAAITGLAENLFIFDSNEIDAVTSAVKNAPKPLQAAIAAALPNEAAKDFNAFQSAVNQLLTAPSALSGFNALPTDVQGFVQSVASQEASIFNNGGSTASAGSAATMAPAVGMGVGLGIGVLGALAL